MTSPVTPSAPKAAWLEQYLEPSIIGAPPYKIDTPSVDIKLDQNESPWDWPAAIKRKIADKLLEKPWNRYPSTFSDDLADRVAAYAGFAPGSVLLGPGSNYLVSLVLTVFTKGIARRQKGAVLVIARPSFPLYESHCNYEGIPYTPWLLDENLEYDVKALPELKPGSMVLFATPNNPVGNALPKATLVTLLEKNPETLFVADEAYCEYTKEQYTDLVGRFSNLILIRTFSKTLGMAGVRIGYVAAHPTYLGYLKKLRLPYLLNNFAIAALDVVLSDPATKDYLATTRRNALHERDRVYEALKPLGARHDYFVKPSEANFILIKWPAQAAAERVYRGLIERRILVRNVSSAPGLGGCLRVTLGDEKENDAFIKAMTAIG